MVHFWQKISIFNFNFILFFASSVQCNYCCCGCIPRVSCCVIFVCVMEHTRVPDARTYVSHLDAPAAVGSSLEVVQRSKTELGSTSHATVSARFLDQSEQPTQYAQQRHRNSGRGQYINSSHTPRDRCVLTSLCSVSISQMPLEMLNCKHNFGLSTQ